MHCNNEYVIVKLEGCAGIKRKVYKNNQNKPYIKLNNRNVILSTIRGKYRYFDKIQN
jgi:hypothetical protein